ncbi:hypothetical protein HJC99_03005 [Candidatus Saccharibacteria bacterium]|nr:hypothetical protein [Candidatus Saccharibacteria bacterium]
MKLRLPSLTITLVGILFVADIVVSFVYAALPTTLTAVRSELDMLLLIIMSITMVGALAWLIDSF